jgi:hypothetical protein
MRIDHTALFHRVIDPILTSLLFLVSLISFLCLLSAYIVDRFILTDLYGPRIIFSTLQVDTNDSLHFQAMVDYGVQSSAETLVCDSTLRIQSVQTNSRDTLKIQYVTEMEFKVRWQDNQDLWAISRVDSGKNIGEPGLYVLPHSFLSEFRSQPPNKISFSSYLKINGLYIDTEDSCVWLLAYNGSLYRSQLKQEMFQFKSRSAPPLTTFAVLVGQLNTIVSNAYDGWQCLELGRKITRDSICLLASSSTREQIVSIFLTRNQGRWALVGIADSTTLARQKSYMQGFTLFRDSLYILDAAKSEMSSYSIVHMTSTGLPDSVQFIHSIRTPPYAEGIAILDTAGTSFLISRRSGELAVYPINRSRWYLDLFSIPDKDGWVNFPYLRETVSRIQDLSVDSEGNYWVTDEFSFMRVNKKAFEPTYLILQLCSARIDANHVWLIVSFFACPLILVTLRWIRLILERMTLRQSLLNQFVAEAEMTGQKKDLMMYHALHDEIPADYTGAIMDALDRLPPCSSDVRIARMLVMRLDDKLRDMARQIYPPELMYDSLSSAIHESTIRYGNQGFIIRFESNGLERLQRVDYHWPDIGRVKVWQILNYLFQFVVSPACLKVEKRGDMIMFDLWRFEIRKAESHLDWLRAKALIQSLHGEHSDAEDTHLRITLTEKDVIRTSTLGPKP